MITEIIKEPTCDDILRAGQVLKNGGLVAFPTETVYGLGANALDADAAKKIYAAKGRPSDNPLIIHLADASDAAKYAYTTKEFDALAERFMPGPLTVILPKRDNIPREVTGGLDSVAVRIPVHPTSNALIRAAGVPIAAPSANLSGRPSPTRTEHVIADMDGRIDMIIDGGEVGIGLESTIIDLTGEEPVILRPGYITRQMLEDVLGSVDIDRTILDINCKLPPRAPGMRYKHYAPKGDLTILEGNQKQVVEAINRHCKEADAKGVKVGVIATDETRESYKADSVKSVGPRDDEEAVGRSLFRILREFDDEGMEVIYSESFGDSGFGQAIMNRLLKAAGHKVEMICEEE